MYKTYSIETLPEVPNCSAISQLPKIGNDTIDYLSDETLIIVSQPTTKDQSDTEYLSRKASLKQFNEHFRKVCNVDDLSDAIDNKVDISSLSTYGTLSCDVENPYIISSFHYDGWNLSSVQGYRLSAAMESILIKTTGMGFQQIKELNSRLSDVENRLSTIENRMSSNYYVQLEHE